jgi:hypothetical protein
VRKIRVELAKTGRCWGNYQQPASRKGGYLMDVVSILLIALSFGVFYGTIQFCDKVVKEQGGKER